MRPADRPRALLLAPSRGLGGGIERYLDTLEWSFAAEGVSYQRVDLQGSGPAAHARLTAQAHRKLRSLGGPARLVLGHRALLPAAALLSRSRLVSGTSVICHGSDVWDARLRPRRQLERRQMRRPGVRVVGVSSYTAGALAVDCPAAVLPPGLSDRWFTTLSAAADTAAPPEPGIRLVTSFRLADWVDKGLPELLAAVAGLDRTDVAVTVCGSGPPPAGLLRLIGQYPFCALRPGLPDHELAAEFAAADLFVLATRTRAGRDACGEGFGMVLLEAQVAGTPVVAPAYGGSHDAFINHVTGLAPADETAAALRRVLHQLLRDPAALAQMGKLASDWARECHAPDRYATRAVATLL